MDDRLVLAGARDRHGKLVLRCDEESARRSRRGELRRVPAEHPHPPQGAQGRLAPLRTELLPALPARGAACAAGRHVDEPRRVPLHRARSEGATRMTDEPRTLRESAKAAADDVSVELSRRRTGMSFQRTRMSADRTLMSVIRTSLSLISFGFTIYQFFEKLKESEVLKSGTTHGPRVFGTTLVWIGIGMLVLGIVYHVQFMIGLRKTREQMIADGLIHGESHFPVSLTLLVALVLL